MRVADLVDLADLADRGANEPERLDGLGRISDARPDPEIGPGASAGQLQEGGLAQSGLANDEQRLPLRPPRLIEDVGDGVRHPVPLPHARSSASGA